MASHNNNARLIIRNYKDVWALKELFKGVFEGCVVPFGPNSPVRVDGTNLIVDLEPGKEYRIGWRRADNVARSSKIGFLPLTHFTASSDAHDLLWQQYTFNSDHALISTDALGTWYVKNDGRVIDNQPADPAGRGIAYGHSKETRIGIPYGEARPLSPGICIFWGKEGSEITMVFDGDHMPTSRFQEAAEELQAENEQLKKRVAELEKAKSALMACCEAQDALAHFSAATVDFMSKGADSMVSAVESHLSRK